MTKMYYHVTTAGRLPFILKTGLKREHRKNVRLSKKVIYVMDNLLEAGYFASQMRWKMEKPVVILFLKLDKRKIKQDKNVGAFGAWKEYHDDISPKQIAKVVHADETFWKEHMKRMDKVFSKPGKKTTTMYI